jgi:hypothetical protein
LTKRAVGEFVAKVAIFWWTPSELSCFIIFIISLGIGTIVVNGFSIVSVSFISFGFIARSRSGVIIYTLSIFFPIAVSALEANFNISIGINKDFSAEVAVIEWTALTFNTSWNRSSTHVPVLKKSPLRNGVISSVYFSHFRAGINNGLTFLSKLIPFSNGTRAHTGSSTVLPVSSSEAGVFSTTNERLNIINFFCGRILS